MLQQNFGLKADTAISGKEAIEKLRWRQRNRAASYKLILMDINMPVLDGVETTKLIRQEFGRKLKNTCIVANTALPRG